MARVALIVLALASAGEGFAVRSAAGKRKKGGAPSKGPGGFGAAPAPPKSKAAGKRISGEKLLELSEDRYAVLEQKYGGDDDDVDEDLVLRDFVVAVRSSPEKSRQFSDWVPVAVVGVVSKLPADACVPPAVAMHRREIVEAARDVAGGKAAKLVFGDRAASFFFPAKEILSFFRRTAQRSSTQPGGL